MNDRPYVSFQEVKEMITLPDVLEALGILDQFQWKGETLTGCCPLPKHIHGPAPNPNQFRMDNKKNLWLWRCFGDCQQGGDVIRFVEEYLEMTSAHVRFWFAQHFADRLSLGKPGTKKGREEVAASTRPNSKNLDQEIVLPLDEELKPLSFQLNLDREDRSYLEERGVLPQTAGRYGLGLCRKGMLRDYLAIPLYRFPKETIDEHPVAYLGRYPGEDYDEENQPRYKLPEGFPKSRIVYGLREALDSRETLPLIVVEGCFSVFHLVQAGYPNVVALLGSELSERQAELLLATDRPLVLMLDGDEAGIAGSRKAAAKLITRQYVRVIKLDSGKSPDQLSEAELFRLLPK